MTWENSAITITTLLPVVGALVIVAMPKDKDRAVRALGIVITGAALVLAVAIAIGFDYGRDGLQYVLDVSWIRAIGVRYHVGIDGISLPLYVLTFLLSFLCAIYSWRYVPDPGRTRAFLALMLLLETGMAGTFIAFDLILFFVFWEMVLVPMYFLIGVWGSANREYASIKFFLYTLFGSIFMLLGFLAMYFQGPDPHTFDMVVLRDFGSDRRVHEPDVPAGRVRGARARVRDQGADVAVPHVAARRPHRGADDRLGPPGRHHAEDGHVRVHPDRAPDPAVRRPEVRALDRRCSPRSAIVYAALACLAQKDLKRLIAFSSVGHMGFVMLGIATLTEIGIQAAIFGMVAHGVITGMLFFCVGSIYDRYHTREIARIGGGMLQGMPKLGGVFAFVAIASLGLPGLAGFWGEFMALLSSFSPNEVVLGRSGRAVPRVHGDRAASARCSPRATSCGCCSA